MKKEKKEAKKREKYRVSFMLANNLGTEHTQGITRSSLPRTPTW
jgi:hypothetical protein